MKLKIAIDGRWLNRNGRGMSKFAHELVVGKSDEVAIIGPPKSWFTKFVLNFVFWEQIFLPYIAWRKQLDFLICPYNTGPLWLYPRTRMILVVHDLIYLSDKYPKEQYDSWYQYLGSYYRCFVVKRAVPRAHHIITVSQTTKKHLRKCFNVSDEKISVIPNSVPDNWFEKQFLKKRKNYIFAVSGSSPNKNLRKLIQSYSILNDLIGAENCPDLIIAGVKENKMNKFIFFATQLGISGNIKFTRYLEDNEMQKMYENCRLFISNSLEEGFGIPVIEALAKNANVCCSDIHVYREIAEHDAYFFNPESCQDTAQTMLNILQNNRQNSIKTSSVNRYARSSVIKIRDKIFRDIF